LPVGRRWPPAFPALLGSSLPRLKMTKLSSLLLHPKWARDRAGHMPMVPTLVPSPILGARLPRQVAAALGLEPAPVTLLAPDPVTKPGLAVVAVAAAPAPALVTLPALVPAVAEAAEVALAAAISPARVPVALTALVPAISPAAVVGTDRQFGDE
jgi:hypothetical protein